VEGVLMAAVRSSCRKIVAVGRNYVAHAKELGNAVPTTPVLFLKPSTSITTEHIEVPQGCDNLHHELELGIVIGKNGRDIPQAHAQSYIKGYVLALDMTARQWQEAAKKAGMPWSVSKGADTFTPISEFIPKSEIQDLSNVEMWLKVDGVEKQRGNTKNMIFNIPSLISYISTIFTLEDGDLILTGTPEGVGPVKPGETITAGITGLEKYDIKFAAVRRPAANL